MTYPPETEEFRAKIRSFLQENLPEGWKGIGALSEQERDAFLGPWRKTLHENGYLAPHWPAAYGGGGLSHMEHVILNEEFARLGVPTSGANDGFSISMVGNTILAVGTEEQKSYFIPRIMSGEDVWCQGYSETEAGSDLANLGCRAELDGDQWIINGQKIWTSSGHTANWIFVLARTAPDEPKHKGISFLLVPMDQAGVEVRPITNMAGHDHFNEVFFTNATCPKENVLGGANNGWAVANTLLGFERGAGATTQYLPFKAELDMFIEKAKELGASSDPHVRQDVARFYSEVQIMRYRGMQALSRFISGKAPGPESSIGKLAWSEYHRKITEAAVNMIGAEAMAEFSRESRGGLGAPTIGTPNTTTNWQASFFVARSGTIYAGTSQVQRGIIGERVLGLPREPRADSGTWRESQAAYR